MTQTITTTSATLLAASPQLKQYVIDNKLMLPEGMSFEDWDACGTWLSAAHDVLDQNLTLIRFLRADWWRFGRCKYGERISQSSAVFDVHWRTVANDASELSTVADAARKVEGATFEQVAGVRAAPAAKQAVILEQAVKEGWSRSEVEQVASGLSEDLYKRQKTLSTMRNAYNRLDKKGRDEFAKWFDTVRAASKPRKTSP